MRAPFQDGDFPGPVKYGYLNVGIVEAGPAELLDRIVFCLYPHQTRYVVPVSAVTRRTGQRAGGPSRPRRHGGDRGERALGRRAAGRRPDRGRRRRHGRLLRRRAGRQGARRPGPAGRPRSRAGRRSRRRSASTFALPDAAAGECDLVVHASATSDGLTRSLELLARGGHRGRAELVRRPPRSACRSARTSTSRRLTIRSSQVGTVSPAQRGRRTYAERLALSLDLLADPAFDALLTGSSAFDELPVAVAEAGQRRAAGALSCHVAIDATVASSTGSVRTARH